MDFIRSVGRYNSVIVTSKRTFAVAGTPSISATSVPSAFFKGEFFPGFSLHAFDTYPFKLCSGFATNLCMHGLNTNQKVSIGSIM